MEIHGVKFMRQKIHYIIMEYYIECKPVSYTTHLDIQYQINMFNHATTELFSLYPDGSRNNNISTN